MKTITLLLSLTFLSACAAIIDGSKREVMIETPDSAHAACKLSNGNGTWELPSTPGMRVVKGAYSNLDISCTDTVTGARGETSINSSVNNWAFGNILFGGIIGVGVDMATGAAYEYPETILVPMSVIADNNAATSLNAEQPSFQPQSMVTATPAPRVQSRVKAQPVRHETVSIHASERQERRYVPIPYGQKLPAVSP